MKIIQVIGGGEKGGSRSHIIDLCSGLADAGHYAEIVCLLEDTVAASARENNIPVRVIPMRSIFDVSAVKKLAGHISSCCPDLVHTHGVRANFIGRLAAKSAEVPVVTTVHSSIYRDYSHPLKKLLYHRIEKLTRKYTGRFIAVAGSLKQELEKDGIPEQRIDVVYNGIKPDFTGDIGKSSLREELGLAPGIPILITIGRMEEVKNQDMFLKVCARLKGEGVTFHAVIVGDGPLAGQLKSKARELGLTDSGVDGPCAAEYGQNNAHNNAHNNGQNNYVSFLGFRRDIYRLLSGSDIFLLTSSMEGLPITLLEAMAAGVPAVVSAVGGMPEVISLAGNGLTFQVDDVEQCAGLVKELLDSPDRRQEMASRGREALEEYFSYRSFVSNTLAVYGKVLRKG